MVLGEAEPAAAGRRASPRPAGAGARRARPPRPSRRRRRCRGRRPGPGWRRRRARSASAADRVGVGDGAAVDPARRSPSRASASSTSAYQSSIGSETKTGPVRRQRGEVGAVGEGQRHVLGPRRLEGPLDQRVRHADRVAVGQVGLQGDLRPRLLAGGDQQRRVVGLGVEDRPHRVADARARCGGWRPSCWPEACAKPSAMPTTTASCRPST